MSEQLRKEWQALTETTRALDKQTIVVLMLSVVLVLVQVTLGSRTLFRTHLASFFEEEWQGVLSWGWWFAVQGVSGFLVPVIILLVFFKRKPRQIGLGLGDWKLASVLAALYIPLVIVATWILSDGSSFQQNYPHYQPAALDWRFFLVYELLFLFYWIGWEYLWRGFVLFGTAHTFGLYAIFVQTVPFALLHLEKPLPEALLSILGGVALGALVWRCRSFWIAVPIHAAQMFILDFWCSIRIRTHVSGIGFDALTDVFKTWLGGG